MRFETEKKEESRAGEVKRRGRREVLTVVCDGRNGVSAPTLTLGLSGGVCCTHSRNAFGSSCTRCTRGRLRACASYLRAVYALCRSCRLLGKWLVGKELLRLITQSLSPFVALCRKRRGLDRRFMWTDESITTFCGPVQILRTTWSTNHIQHVHNRQIAQLTTAQINLRNT